MSNILVNDLEAVRTLMLNRPEKRNALNAELVEALKMALRDAHANDDLRAIVIRGAGKDFCSGADLESIRSISESSYDENLEDARRLAELFALIRHVQIPVIAAVHGRALAGGCGLATACDMVIATESARFGYPEVKIGFVPAIVMAFLRRNLGEKRAFEIATQGFEFSAAEAERLGLINHAIPDESFEEGVAKFAEVYENVSRSAVVLSKKLLYEMDSLGFDDAIEAGAKANAEARMSEDCKKGIAEFLNKE
ncbi:MAG TPA: enoyl-CoA hydratase-related protein [Pyrinomonadaceae bacterium]|nr:enoyl-CoA hydratase-related protein [Pyrinomonadaceae bacterium]